MGNQTVRRLADGGSGGHDRHLRRYIYISPFRHHPWTLHGGIYRRDDTREQHPQSHTFGPWFIHGFPDRKRHETHLRCGAYILLRQRDHRGYIIPVNGFTTEALTLPISP